MNRSKATFSAFLLAPTLALASAQARAEYKCDAPEHRLDRVACEKAAENPDALRHYIQRMRPIESLQFSDYVNEAQARAWTDNQSSRTLTRTLNSKAAIQSTTPTPEHSGA